jgi:hypothetical protein
MKPAQATITDPPASCQCSYYLPGTLWCRSVRQWEHTAGSFEPRASISHPRPIISLLLLVPAFSHTREIRCSRVLHSFHDSSVQTKNRKSYLEITASELYMPPVAHLHPLSLGSSWLRYALLPPCFPPAFNAGLRKHPTTPPTVTVTATRTLTLLPDNVHLVPLLHIRVVIRRQRRNRLGLLHVGPSDKFPLLQSARVLEQFVLEGIVDVLLDDDVFGVTLRTGRKSHTHVSPCFFPHRQITQPKHDTRSKRLLCKRLDKTIQHGTTAQTPLPRRNLAPMFICLFVCLPGRAGQGMA